MPYVEQRTGRPLITRRVRSGRGLGQTVNFYGCNWWDILCQAGATQAKLAAESQGGSAAAGEAAAEAFAAAYNSTSVVGGITAPGTPGATAPPAAAAPAAPQTITQMTVPGAYTPEESGTDTAANSLQAFQDYFNQVGTQQGAAACDDNFLCCSFNTLCGIGIPTWGLAVGAGLLAWMIFGGKH